MLIKLSEYANRKGICYKTAYNRFKNNKIKNAHQDEKTKTIMVDYIDTRLTKINDIKKILIDLEDEINDSKKSC